MTRPPLTLTEVPIVRAEMLIRRPVATVFEAFVDPSITTNFWFSGSSGRLEPGAHVRWDWEVYGVFADVQVEAVERDERISLVWGDPTTRVEWRFTPRGEGATFVAITNAGFAGDGDEVVRQALDACGGFTYVLAGAKAWLEHGIRLDLVADHAPDAHVNPPA